MKKTILLFILISACPALIAIPAVNHSTAEQRSSSIPQGKRYIYRHHNQYYINKDIDAKSSPQQKQFRKYHAQPQKPFRRNQDHRP